MCYHFSRIVNLVASNCYSKSLCYYLVLSYVDNNVEVDYVAASWHFTFSNEFYCSCVVQSILLCCNCGLPYRLGSGSFIRCLYSCFSHVIGSITALISLVTLSTMARTCSSPVRLSMMAWMYHRNSSCVSIDSNMDDWYLLSCTWNDTLHAHALTGKLCAVSWIDWPVSGSFITSSFTSCICSILTSVSSGSQSPDGVPKVSVTLTLGDGAAVIGGGWCTESSG